MNAQAPALAQPSSAAEQPALFQELVQALSCEFTTNDKITPSKGTLRLASREAMPEAGWCDISVIRPGFFVTSVEIQHELPIERRYNASDLIKFHFCISGGNHIEGDHGGSAEMKSASLACITQPADSEKLEMVEAKSCERTVTLSCSRDFISDVADNCSIKLPNRILDFAKGKPSPFLCEQVPLPQQLRLLAEDILAVRNSAFEHLLKEARSLELLSLALLHISTASDARPLHDRDYERVRHLCKIIEQEESQLHSIAELSRLVAWNETQMMDCFKKITGTTINSYRQRHRMGIAMRRLRTSNVSITELAFDLGYEHPGNFATAFRKTFGFSPRAARNTQSS